MPRTGSNATLKRGSTEVANIKKITHNEPTRGKLDVTPLKGDTNAMRKIPESKTDPGQIVVEVFWDPVNTTHRGLEDGCYSDAVEEWVVEYADGSADTYKGFLVSFAKGDSDRATAMMGTATIEIDGLPAFTPASAS